MNEFKFEFSLPKLAHSIAYSKSAAPCGHGGSTPVHFAPPSWERQRHPKKLTSPT
jgi:hypothetical protein